MILTDECKEAFEDYLDQKYGLDRQMSGYHQFGATRIRKDLFFELPCSMQYGVLVDFFDANDIEVEDCMKWDKTGFLSLVDGNYCNSVKDKGGYLAFESRHEAREKAIEAANLIYNERA